MPYSTKRPALDQPSPASVRGLCGPESNQFYFLARPTCPHLSLVAQVRNLYTSLRNHLARHGQTFGDVVSETVYFRDIGGDLHRFHEARAATLHELGAEETYEPATMWVGQPPLVDGVQLELLAKAVNAKSGSALESRNVCFTGHCECRVCGSVNARVIRPARRKHVHVGNVLGPRGDVYDEAYGMFRRARETLECEGMDFRSVVRTWIYLRNMRSDYAEFNRARRDFFEEVGVTTFPASTGIRGASVAPTSHRFSMSLHAIESPLEVKPLRTTLLNEAPEYGSDFSRGLKVVEAQGTTLYVSGTASVDEWGRTVHVGDLERQIERMLANVSALLESEGASFADVVSATSYLKRYEDAPRLRDAYRRHRIDGFPHALVEADVCRPDLLCEMEVTALLAP